jgi:hypothetical protein
MNDLEFIESLRKKLMTEEEILKQIDKWAYCIEYVSDQTEAMCKRALTNNIYSYKYIKNKNENIENFCFKILLSHYNLPSVDAFISMHKPKYNSTIRLVETYKLFA